MTVASRLGISAAAIAAAVVLTIAFAALQKEPPTTSIIGTSGTFDVTNLRHLAGYADNVFVGHVTVVVGVEDNHTQYQVSVDETVKGNLDGEVVVSQLGYVADNETHVTEDQPLLTVGETYLLVTNPDTTGKDWQILITGPTTAIPVENGNRADVIERYKGAVANQMYPPDLPPKK